MYLLILVSTDLRGYDAIASVPQITKSGATFLTFGLKFPPTFGPKQSLGLFSL